MNNKKIWVPGLLIGMILMSLFLHRDYLTLDIQGIHSWRQSQTMWNIRNFARYDANILNPRVSKLNMDGTAKIYRYEFPVLQWSIGMMQKVVGEEIVFVRLFMFGVGIFSVVGMYFLGNFIFKSWWIGLAMAFFFQFSPLFYYYTINPMPDCLALAAGIWFIYFSLLYEERRETRVLVLAGICLLMSTWAKLPFLMFSILTIYFFFKNMRWNRACVLRQLQYAAIPLLLVLPALVWYAWVMPGWSNNPVTTGIFGAEFDLRNYLGILKFHVTSMFPKTLLYITMWPLFFLGMVGILRDQKHLGWMVALIGITSLYFLLELTTIDRHHDYYMMPFLPWLYVMVGYGVYFLSKIELPVFRKYKIPTLFILALIITSPNQTIQRTKNAWSLEVTGYLTGFVDDYYYHSDILREAVPADAKCIIVNDPSTYMYSYRIDKRGFFHLEDHFPVGWFKDLIDNHGATYLYSDSDKINQLGLSEGLMDSLVIEIGCIKVFRLNTSKKHLNNK